MNNVIVSVVGVQRDVYDQENVIEQTLLGRFYRKNGVNYITYQEKEVTDIACISTILKVYSDQIVLLRMGGIEHKQVFRLGEKTYSIYSTPQGKMQMSVLTNRLNVVFGIGTSVVDIGYELEIEGQWQSSNSLSVSIREVQNSGH